MKNHFLFLFLLVSISVISQNTLKGKITGKDDIPLKGANIYFDGTTISTISDAEGNYTIEFEPSANRILVVSIDGYENEYISSFDSLENFNIHLHAAKNSLNEVVVSRKDKFSRSQKLKIFREYFIGKTVNSEKVVIQNENDIYFKYDKQNFILKAFSDKPLIILNPSLGYKISYQLQKFEITFSNLSIFSRDVIKNFYVGMSLFEETANSEVISKKREEAFKGSQINFFRNLVNNVWSKDEFLMSKNYDKVFSENCFKISKGEFYTKVEVVKQPKEKNKNESYIASYDLLFKNKEESSVIFETDTFYVYKYGNNSNISDIVFLGQIGEERVAEMLPLNYAIK
ncbi:carboxypeptidase-like regulatory domain-containing protein [Flavobacterium sp. T12S277]|uniref:carboxypeptidase-like regulatory domain-containing protein n=1 Tax=Flavobacterium sp. T12S277 TaxID=3402752 RepID=UPI003AD911A5